MSMLIEYFIDILNCSITLDHYSFVWIFSPTRPVYPRIQFQITTDNLKGLVPATTAIQGDGKKPEEIIMSSVVKSPKLCYNQIINQDTLIYIKETMSMCKVVIWNNQFIGEVYND